LSRFHEVFKGFLQLTRTPPPPNSFSPLRLTLWLGLTYTLFSQRFWEAFVFRSDGICQKGFWCFFFMWWITSGGMSYFFSPPPSSGFNGISPLAFLLDPWTTPFWCTLSRDIFFPSSVFLFFPMSPSGWLSIFLLISFRSSSCLNLETTCREGS